MMAHSYTNIIEGGHTIKGDALIEESALNEVRIKVSYAGKDIRTTWM